MESTIPKRRSGPWGVGQVKRQLEAVVGSSPAPGLPGANFSPGSARLSPEPPAFRGWTGRGLEINTLGRRGKQHPLGSPRQSKIPRHLKGMNLKEDRQVKVKAARNEGTPEEPEEETMSYGQAEQTELRDTVPPILHNVY